MAQRLRQEHQLEWDRFPNLPGTHLSWRRSGIQTFDLVSTGNSVWATVHARGAYGSKANHRLRIIVNGRTYSSRRVGRSKDAKRELVDVSNGRVIFSSTGLHYNNHANTQVVSPGEGSFRFPVRSTRRAGLMSAIDESGKVLAEFRLKNQLVGYGVGLLKVEAVVGSVADSCSNIALLVIFGSPLLPWFFRRDVPFDVSG